MELTYIAPVLSSGYYKDTDTGRSYTVDVDTDADDPRGWIEDAHCAVYIYRACNMRAGSARTVPDNPACEAFDFFYNDKDYEDGEALDMTRRYMNLFYPRIGYDMDVLTLTGYSQSDWWEVFAVTKEGYGKARDAAEQVGKWLRGDVYQVGCIDTGEAIGGIYADSAEDAVAHYIEEYEDEH